jgi:hypothetical protein
MQVLVPTIKLANYRYRSSIRRPYGEVYTGRIQYRNRMITKATISPVPGTLLKIAYVFVCKERIIPYRLLCIYEMNLFIPCHRWYLLFLRWYFFCGIAFCFTLVLHIIRLKAMVWLYCSQFNIILNTRSVTNQK